MRRRRAPIVFVVPALLAGAATTLGVVSWVVEDVPSDLSEQETTCCWEEGMTPTWMSDQIGMRIPGAASDRRAGYKVGQRYDTGLSSFVLSSTEAEAHTGGLIRDDTRMIKNFYPEGLPPRGCLPSPRTARTGDPCERAAEDQLVS